MPRFCCLSIPDFPAWAVVRTTPTLTHQPLLVYAGGRIIAASAGAREAGAETGWTLTRAQSLIPNAIPIPHHAPTTAAAWEEVLGSLYELTPWIESIRPGLAIADVHPASSVIPLLRTWQAHGGVADDRTTAEVAAYSTQPGTLRNVRPRCSPAFLRKMPLSVLEQTGVRPPILERLGWFGWRTIGDLHRLTKRQLIAQFDQGELLFRYAQTSDTRPVATYVAPPTVAAHYSFEEPANEPCELHPVLDWLVGQVASQLQDRIAHSLTVGLETAQGRQRARRLLRDPTADPITLRDASLRALEGLLRPDLAVTEVEVQLGGLIPAQAVQGQLFAWERPAATTAIATMEARFPGLLQRIVTTNPHAYLPEEYATFEPVTLTARTSKRTSPSGRSKPAKQHSNSRPQPPKWAVPR